MAASLGASVPSTRAWIGRVINSRLFMMPWKEVKARVLPEGWMTEKVGMQNESYDSSQERGV